jgi:TolB protein
VAGTIRRLGPEGTFYQPMMHPDGTKVVFWGKESKDLNVKKFNIWVCNIDNTNCRQLTGDDESEGPSWSLDGKHIVYTRWIGKGMGKVWIMDADGSNKRALTTGPGEDARPFMSPDGRTVVFASNRSGRFYLYRTDINGAEPIQITFSDTQKDFRPAFSWDGRSLAFYRHVPGASRTIAIMKFPDGKPTIPFFMKAGEGFFHGAFWSRDGRHVLAHGRRGELSVRLYLIEVATGKMEPVMVPGFRAWGHGSWDRDMKVMAFDGTRVLAE